MSPIPKVTEGFAQLEKRYRSQAVCPAPNKDGSKINDMQSYKPPGLHKTIIAFRYGYHYHILTCLKNFKRQLLKKFSTNKHYLRSRSRND